MTVEEFYEIRRPFYIDVNTGCVKFADTRHRGMSIADWFTDIGYQWTNIVRGYYWETDDHENDHITIYADNYNIPNVNIGILTYLFAHFSSIKYVGLGCKISTPGEIWEPQIIVYNNSVHKIK